MDRTSKPKNLKKCLKNLGFFQPCVNLFLESDWFPVRQNYTATFP